MSSCATSVFSTNKPRIGAFASSGSEGTRNQISSTAWSTWVVLSEGVPKSRTNSASVVWPTWIWLTLCCVIGFGPSAKLDKQEQIRIATKTRLVFIWPTLCTKAGTNAAKSFRRRQRSARPWSTRGKNNAIRLQVRGEFWNARLRSKSAIAPGLDQDQFLGATGDVRRPQTAPGFVGVLRPMARRSWFTREPSTSSKASII